MALPRDGEKFIDRLYEAAAFAELWPKVLNQLAHAVDAAGSMLLACDTDWWPGTWSGGVSSASVAPAMAALLSSDICRRSQAIPRLLALDRPDFANITEGFSAEEWAADPLYAEWCRPWSFGYIGGTAIRSPSGEFFVARLLRRAGSPPFSREQLDLLDSFRPHLARATLLAARWRFERLRIAAEALSSIGLPALIIDGDARVLGANKLIENLSGHVKWLAKDRVALTDPAADKMLRRGLAGLADPASPSVRSFAARSRSDGTAIVAHLIPTPGQARDLFDGALGVLVLTPVTALVAPDAALIRGLFDLTPKEAGVARAIALGLTVNQIAADAGVSRETIRSQIKSVLRKTGSRDQLEAVALFGGLPKLPKQ